jgi:hypothetical protein
VHRVTHLSIMNTSEPFQMLTQQEEHSYTTILRHGE